MKAPSALCFDLATSSWSQPERRRVVGLDGDDGPGYDRRVIGSFDAETWIIVASTRVASVSANCLPIARRNRASPGAASRAISVPASEDRSAIGSPRLPKTVRGDDVGSR
jgi:hypothetical protein